MGINSLGLILLSLLAVGLVLNPLQQTFAEEATDTEALPLISFTAVTYSGGFRLPTGKFGAGDNSSHSYSPGPIAYNPENHSLFTVSHSYEQGIGEFAIPEVSRSTDSEDFDTATVLQNFRPFHSAGSAPTGIDNYFLVTGLSLANNKLLVNFINWYDASGQETDTTAVFQTPSDLAETEIVGPFQLNGAAHAAGWLTPIPNEWQAALGGNHIAGHAHGSIVSRLSVGPPAHVLDVNDLTSASAGAPITTTPVLDFSLAMPLYDKSLYDLTTTPYSEVAYNDDGRNRLWTRISGASYGFIIPNTGTYMTLGYAGGFYSKLGYKITQTNGNVCGGPCSYDPEDNYNHYWLWKVEDLVRVKNGEMLASDVRPYEYGQLDTLGNKARIKGAAYDAQTNQLYISLQNGDTIPTYARPPLILVFTIDPKVTAPARNNDACFVIPKKLEGVVVFCL
jgi:hypothetical protein